MHFALLRPSKETRLCENHLRSSPAITGETASKCSADIHADQRQKLSRQTQSEMTQLQLHFCCVQAIIAFVTWLVF